MRRLIDAGLALRGGAVAEFPSITLTNHTSILTGLGPGRHGVLGNVFYDRATGERVVPNDASTWHRSAEWLRPAVRTVFEMVNDAVPPGAAPRTACIDEPIDRGADYSTMALIRASESSRGAAGLGDLLPDPRASAAPAHPGAPRGRVLPLVHPGRRRRAAADAPAVGRAPGRRRPSPGGPTSSPTPATTAAVPGRTSPATRCATPTPGWARSWTTWTASGSSTR